MKKVYCLYRVSTKGQVEKDDIPMQRQYCREFVGCHPDWEITREFYEKGVSGFKLSAKERDEIQEIQQDAVQGLFDVLLVYMFDRLGRRDDETPFVVEWFVRNGIEVWSAIEGQQRFDSHVDKLMNYIRFWQASGESIKTAIRVKTRLEQMTEEGLFTGGGVPYGYRVEHLGRVNKRNKPVGDMVIDPEASEIVKMIFYKYVYEGYGAQRLSRYMAENNIRKPDGRNFPNVSINRIIKNPIYTGVVQNGDAQSAVIPALQIIDPETYKRAQEIMVARTQKRSDVPLNTKSRALLVGKVFCGHCRNRLTLTTTGRRRVNKQGEVTHEARPRYQCHYRVRHPGDCDGQSGYGVKKLDALVNEVIRYQFSKIRNASYGEIIHAKHESDIQLAKAQCKMLSMQLAEKERELADYQAEIIRIIRGESKLDADMLNELVAETRAKIMDISVSLNQRKEAHELLLKSDQQETDEYAKLKSWADLYDKCSFETKKMIIAQFVKSIYVYEDYHLEIEFNVSFEEFMTMVTDGEVDVI